MENVRNNVNINFSENDDDKKTIRKQSEPTFMGSHKSLQFMIAMYLSKMKFSSISCFNLFLLYYN